MTTIASSRTSHVVDCWLVSAIACLRRSVPALVRRTTRPKTAFLRMGFIPAEDSRAMVRQSQDILDIVAKQTGHEDRDLRRLRLQRDRRSVAQRARRCRAARALLLHSRDHAGAGRSLRRDGDRQDRCSRVIKSIIIAAKDSPITSMETLKGHTFAFVDPGSTSGFMVPSAAFKKARHHAGKGLQAGDVFGRP